MYTWKYRIIRLQSTTPEKLFKKGDPRRDTHGGPQEGEIVKIFWVLDDWVVDD